MPRVLFTVNYTIPEQQRKNYLELITQLKSRYAGSEVQHNVFEMKGKRNGFQEIYVYNSQDSFDASDELEERLKVSEIVEKITEIAQNVQYNVGYEA